MGPQFRRRDLSCLFKNFAEIINVIETGCKRNFRNAHRRVAQQIFRLVDADFIDIFGDRLIGQLFKQAAEMVTAETGDLRQVIHGNFFLMILFDVLKTGVKRSKFLMRVEWSFSESTRST